VAEYALIEGYLETLHRSIRFRRDAEDLVAEVHDHLLEAIEFLEHRGTGSLDAQQETLARFGDPVMLARAFASTPRGGIAVPTQFTRVSGIFSIVSGVLWLAMIALWWFGNWREDVDGTWEGAAQVSWILGTGAALSAGAFLIVAMVGMNQRHGGLGLLGNAGVALTGLGVAGLLIAWFFYGWGTAIGIGTLLLGAALLRRDLAPRLPTYLFTVGFTVGGITVAVLNFTEFGYRDVWGYRPTANLIGITVGIVILALGLFGLGNWLRGETPVELPDQTVAA
jgi:hypothetical protein